MPVPVFCCFSISGFPHIKSALKIPGKIQEKSAYRELPEKPRQGQRGAWGGPGGHPARPHPWPRQGAPRAPSPPLVTPFCIYMARVPKPPRRNYSRIMEGGRNVDGDESGGPPPSRQDAGTGILVPRNLVAMAGEIGIASGEKGSGIRVSATGE